jgi:hypothetical protein
MAGKFPIPTPAGPCTNTHACKMSSTWKWCFQSPAVPLDVFNLGSWPASGKNQGREGLIPGRTIRAGLDKLLPVAFCGTQLTKKGFRRGDGEFFYRFPWAFCRVQGEIGGLLVPARVPADATEKKTRNFWYADVLHMLWGVTPPSGRRPMGPRCITGNGNCYLGDSIWCIISQWMWFSTYATVAGTVGEVGVKSHPLGYNA